MKICFLCPCNFELKKYILNNWQFYWTADSMLSTSLIIRRCTLRNSSAVFISNSSYYPASYNYRAHCFICDVYPPIRTKLFRFKVYCPPFCNLRKKTNLSIVTWCKEFVFFFSQENSPLGNLCQGNVEITSSLNSRSMLMNFQYTVWGIDFPSPYAVLLSHILFCIAIRTYRFIN